jgi:DNA repair exonuclease SbcCD nuclease subunit
MIAIIGDIHFGIKSFDKKIFEFQMEFFKKQFFPFLKEKKIKTVIHLGDFFNDREILDIYILNKIYTEFISFFEKNGITFYSILGNHDIYYKNTLEIHSLKLFENLKYFKVIDKPQIIQLGKYKCYFVPWLTNLKEFEFKKSDILFGHFEFKDFYIIKNYKSSFGFNLEDFKQYKLIFSGHFHIASKKDNLIYTGTPYQLSWNDFGENKGFCILKDNFEYIFIPNFISPTYRKIIYTEKDNKPILFEDTGKELKQIKNKEQLKEVINHNFVKIFVENIKNETKFDNFYNKIMNLEPIEIKVKFLDDKNEDEEKKQKIEKISDTDEMIEEYIKEFYKEHLELIDEVNRLKKEILHD